MSVNPCVSRAALVTDPQGSTTTFAYDAADRLISETYPGGQLRSYSYHANGLRQLETNPKGEITRYHYDDAGQLTSLEYFASATALQNNQPGKTVGFQYTALGQLSQYQDGTTSGAYTYTVLGQLDTVSVNYGPFSKNHSYTYNADGRKQTYTNPEGVTYTYSYNANGDFQSLTIPGEGTIAVTAYHWRAPAEWLFPGGTRIVTATDGLLRPSQTSLLDPGSNPHASRLYIYNAENHITGIHTEEGVHLYTLDELYRLTAAAYQYNEQLQQQAQLLRDEHYSYDGVGNRLTDSADANGGSWQYNVNHQLTERPEHVYAYDANGHTLSKTETGTGIITQFQYDITERLTAVSKTDQNGTTPLGQYRYDPFGRRVRKVSQSETLYFHYDDTGLLAEYDAQGNLVREYQYTPGSTWMTKPLFLRDVQTGKVHYYYNSHLGQPLKLFDRQGRTTWEARSQAFGELLVVVEEVENRLRFPGQYFDGESGFYHNFRRDYDVIIGRYFQQDPIRFLGGINFYNYTGGSPVSFSDPMGLKRRKDLINNPYCHFIRMEKVRESYNERKVTRSEMEFVRADSIPVCHPASRLIVPCYYVYVEHWLEHIYAKNLYEHVIVYREVYRCKVGCGEPFETYDYRKEDNSWSGDEYYEKAKWHFKIVDGEMGLGLKKPKQRGLR
ncbi:MAG: RHS repeat domain-containing protein [Alcanivoracaceae bacterium]